MKKKIREIKLRIADNFAETVVKIQKYENA